MITKIKAFSKQILLTDPKTYIPEADLVSKEVVLSTLRDFDEEIANEVAQTNFEYRIEGDQLIIVRTDASFG